MESCCCQWFNIGPRNAFFALYYFFLLLSVFLLFFRHLTKSWFIRQCSFSRLPKKLNTKKTQNTVKSDIGQMSKSTKSTNCTKSTLIRQYRNEKAIVILLTYRTLKKGVSKYVCHLCLPVC